MFYGLGARWPAHIAGAVYGDGTSTYEGVVRRKSGVWCPWRGCGTKTGVDALHHKSWYCLRGTIEDVPESHFPGACGDVRGRRQGCAGAERSRRARFSYAGRQAQTFIAADLVDTRTAATAAR